MTTHQLRKEITVTGWHLGTDGVSVNYTHSKSSQHSIDKNIRITPENVVRHLDGIGSIDSWEGDPFVIYWVPDDFCLKQTWDEFVLSYNFTQWDALNIVINYELEKATEEDIDKGDIGRAIKKIL